MLGNIYTETEINVFYKPKKLVSRREFRFVFSNKSPWGVWELAEPSLPACFSGTNQMCVSNLTAQGAYFWLDEFQYG